LKPYLQTVFQGTRLPVPEEIPLAGAPSGHCEFRER
jgi:hypothetical protein